MWPICFFAGEENLLILEGRKCHWSSNADIKINVVILDSQASKSHCCVKSICRPQCSTLYEFPLLEFQKFLSITCGHFFYVSTHSPPSIYELQMSLGTLGNCLSSIAGATELMKIHLILLGRIQKLSYSLYNI